MKKKYKILRIIILAELALLFPLGIISRVLELFFSIKLQLPEIASAIVAPLFLAPIVYLLYLVSRDDNIVKGKRTLAVIGMWFLILCYIGGIIGMIFTKYIDLSFLIH